MSRLAFGVALMALIGVLLLDVLKGVLLAAIVSLLMLLRSAARAHVAARGRIPGTRRYSDLARNPDNEPIPGALRLRVERSHEWWPQCAVQPAVLEPSCPSSPSGDEHECNDTDPRVVREEIAATFADAPHLGRHATGPRRSARDEPGALAD